MGVVAYFSFGSDNVGPHFIIGKAVGVITVDGPITSADATIKEIKELQKNDDIKSVVLRIESPGGSVAASQEILEAVKKLAEKKPVIASMGSVAASGGYYIACGANKILANDGTITGSIGVRMEHVMLGDLFKWAKIHHETLTSGRFKDLASIDRPMTKEERGILQSVLDDIHAQFKETVAKARNIEPSKIDLIADGRVYTGRQAKELGLIDEIGGFTEAIALAAKLGNIKDDDPKLIRPKKHNNFIDRFFDSADALINSGLNGILLEYWQPLMFVTGT